MKTSVFFISSVISILFGCKENIAFKEVVSQREIAMTLPSSENSVDSITLIVPVEFTLNLNFPDIKDVRAYYTYNNRSMSQPQDFIIENAQTNKIIFAIEDMNYQTYPKSINIINRKIYLSRKRAEQLLAQYKIKKNLQSLKSKSDTLNIISYSKFRETQPDFLQEMRNIPDSLILSLGLKNGKSKILKEKINW